MMELVLLIRVAWQGVGVMQVSSELVHAPRATELQCTLKGGKTLPMQWSTSIHFLCRWYEWWATSKQQ
jgi:hypothetical protein